MICQLWKVNYIGALIIIHAFPYTILRHMNAMSSKVVDIVIVFQQRF